MNRLAARLTFAAALAGGAAASPAAAEVQVQALTAPALFSAGARDTGLGPDLWKGASADLARQVIPQLAARPLSPAAAGLTRRVLATPANAPEGAGADLALAGARAQALLAVGDARTVVEIAERTNGVSNNAALSQAAAEAALLSDQDDKACQTADALTVDRDGVYWLRLRAFCQASSRQPAAQLTFDLAEQKAKDPVYARMMGVLLAGGGDPGAASLRNGLDYALSRKLGLDIAAALPKASPAVAEASGARLRPADIGDLSAAEAAARAALKAAKTPSAFVAAARAARPTVAALAAAGAPMQEPVLFAEAALAAGDVKTAQAVRGGLTGDAIPGAGVTDLAVLDAALAAASGRTDAQTLDQLVDRGTKDAAKARARPQAAAALLAALGAPMTPDARAAFVEFDLGKPAATPARLLALDLSAEAGRTGETALLALSVVLAAGPAGPSPADRARIVRALARGGLKTDARAFALEGLLALR